MKKLILLLASLALLGFSACGYKEGVSTAASKSYFYFTGDTKNAQVSIDNGEKFSVEAGRDNQYSVKPGKHLVEVYKNDELVVKREVFLSDGITKEIEVR
jgi:hypothetical protein